MFWVLFFPFLPGQEDYDHMSVLEDQHYQVDGSVMSPKAKLLLRDAKKELLRCVA